jgi:glycosyltransferase involved in cell wall biosynthesis
MKLGPLVSVIIPAYNASSWIVETIDSVLSQDYQNIEIIVIDDGSTDDTRNIINTFGNDVKYFYKNNGGQSSARNLALKYAKGKYVAFIDSDDLWETNKLSLQVELLESTGLKWVYSDGIAFDSSTKLELFKFSQKSEHYKGDILVNLFKSCFIPMPSVIVNNEVFQKVGFFNEDNRFRNREDWEMWIRIAESYPVAYISKELVKYRVHKNSVTGTESLIQRLNGNILVIEQAVQRNPYHLEKYQNQVLSELYYSVARALAIQGNSQNAKLFFAKAIKQKPFSIIFYVSWLLAPLMPLIENFRGRINFNHKINN